MIKQPFVVSRYDGCEIDPVWQVGLVAVVVLTVAAVKT